MKFCTIACKPKPIPTDNALATQAMRSTLMPSPASAAAITTTPNT